MTLDETELVVEDWTLLVPGKIVLLLLATTSEIRE